MKQFKITKLEKKKVKKSDFTAVAFPKPGPRKKKKKSGLQKKKDNSSSNYWKKKCDTAWGELIHTKYDRCQVCHNSNVKLEAHHLISKSQIITRHKIINGILLCSDHHKFNVECSPHKGPIGFAIWLKNNRPEQFGFVETNKYLTGSKVDYEEKFKYLTAAIEFFK